MKIAFLGNFSVPYCSEVHYARTFEKLGHTVQRLQENIVSTDQILNAAKDADMFFWVHTHGWNPRGFTPMRDVLRKLEARGIPTVAYHLDLYMGLQRWKEYENADYFQVKHFFTVDKLMADWLNANTETKGYYLLAGVLEDECYIGERKEHFAHDVIFVGSKNYHHEWPYRPELINWLSRTYGDRFAHYGGDGRGVIRGADLNNLYASAKIVIGDTLCIGYDYPYYFSDRIFETTGRGGFIIHPYIKGIEEAFELDNSRPTKQSDVKPKELVTYTFADFSDLKHKIDFYLEHPATRQEIQQAGFERTKRDHTYTNRMQAILDAVGASK